MIIILAYQQLHIHLRVAIASKSRFTTFKTFSGISGFLSEFA